VEPSGNVCRVLVTSGHKKLSGPAVFVAWNVIDGVAGLDGRVGHAAIVHELELFVSFPHPLTTSFLSLIAEGGVSFKQGGLFELGLGILLIACRHSGVTVNTA
jgi:hypothetical protein